MDPIICGHPIVNVCNSTAHAYYYYFFFFLVSTGSDRDGLGYQNLEKFTLVPLIIQK